MLLDANVVKTDYSITFWQKPPVSITPLVQSGSTNTATNALFQAECQTLLDKGLIEIPEDRSSPDFYSRLFSVPKPNSQWRPVTDLSLLNNYIKILKFKMDTPQKVRASMKQGRWVFRLYLKDAYFQILIIWHPEST